MILAQMRALSIETPRVYSSELAIHSTKSDLVLDICKAVEATTYLSGPLGRDYLDLQQFRRASIEVLFHDYHPVPYSQAWPGFESHLAAFDAIACHPPEQAIEIMQAGRTISPATD